MSFLSRNAESRFAINPTNLDISRSRFDRTSTVKTTFDVGQIVPFYIDECVPGDTFDVSCAKVVRMQPMVSQPMDDLFLDTYFFFVPNRLLWDHWVNLMGENTQSAWYPTVEYSVPQVNAPKDTGWEIGTLADYFGIPTGITGFSVNALPFRAYTKIINDWFRDQNVVRPLYGYTGDSTLDGTNSDTADNYSATDLGGKPFIAAKYHDYFTSCLPSPQKGPDVQIPIVGVQVPIDIPVQTAATINAELAANTPALAYQTAGYKSQGLFTTFKTLAYEPSSNVNTNNYNDGQDPIPTISGGFAPLNLRAVGDAVGSAGSYTINQLRMAFQLQKLYEKDARGGTRYIEMIKTHFGVTSPDARLQRSEYLGGNRIRLTVHQVVQQSATNVDTTPQGNPVGLCVTHDNADSFCRSFTEHGFVIGVMCARYPHTYQQGLERFWSRKNRLDYYFPVFANIGEQPVLNKELYLQQGQLGELWNDKAFGYQEAWADYRFKPSRVTGQMRSGHNKSLDMWHFADTYNELPTLSSSWIREDKANVDRVLAISSNVSNQLFADIVISNKTSRPMPLYSIPGLLDHH